MVDALKLHMQLAGSYRLVGIPDWSSSIPEGCVVIVDQGLPEEAPRQVGGCELPGRCGLDERMRE